ncbi:IS1/IS1595 family N-terminal zinc-binding domain-containing protein [Paenibacillus alba]
MIRCPDGYQRDCVSTVLRKRGRTDSGKQRYTCDECGYTFSVGEDMRRSKGSKSPSYMSCTCGSKSVVMHGTWGEYQRYRCKECGKTFSYLV